jgi:hypothetical protein
MKDGKFRLMRRTEQPAVIYDVVGEVDTKEEAERKVGYLTMCNEEDNT